MELRVEDLTCARGGVPVLEGVSFTLAAGEALILRGPNGSGKTTLLRTVAGLQPALRGRITHPPEALAYAGHLDGIKATLTVAENLTFWASVFGGPGVGGALDAFDLTDLSGRPAGMLSAGQKRRLGLARMAVTGRPIWLLDEPTVSLDADAVARFAGTLKAHLADGGAALIATHIDLRLEAPVFDTGRHRAREGAPDSGGFDEAFL